MIIYHGIYCAIEKPEIHISRYSKDFGNEFYFTEKQAQAEKWTKHVHPNELRNLVGYTGGQMGMG